jgi:DNA repair photolyase
MILNISGRTDIVAFYTPWFINRLKAGYVDVRNPFYPKKVSRIYFDDVELFVFCTKNPLPIIPYLKDIKKPIIFHVTLTPYNKDIEQNVISKTKIIDGIKEISKIIGSQNLYIRYDPILINEKYTIEYHKKAFFKMCSLLDGYVEHIIVSFIDLYKNVKNNANVLKLKEITDDDYKEIGLFFSRVANEHNMTVQTCYEENDLSEYGFLKKVCMSKQDALELTGKKYKKWQARKCGCVEMVDIGYYNSCSHLCKYCYANYDEAKVLENMKLHDVNSSMIIGSLQDDDEITIRKR